MQQTHFREIIADIEKNIEGNDGYHIQVQVGLDTLEGAWQYLNKSTEDVIVLSIPDQPPVYVPIAYIQYINLCA